MIKDLLKGVYAKGNLTWEIILDMVFLIRTSKCECILFIREELFIFLIHHFNQALFLNSTHDSGQLNRI